MVRDNKTRIHRMMRTITIMIIITEKRKHLSFKIPITIHTLLSRSATKTPFLLFKKKTTPPSSSSSTIFYTNSTHCTRKINSYTQILDKSIFFFLLLLLLLLLFSSNQKKAETKTARTPRCK